MGPTPPLALIQFCALAFAAAALATAARHLWRGARVGQVPHCRRCDHNLTGLPAGSGRCPECGADLSADDEAGPAVVRGERRVNRPAAWLLTGAAVALGLVALPFAWRAVPEVDWRAWWASAKPTAWLVDDVRSGEASAEPEFVELRGRFERGGLDGDDVERVADALAAQSPTARATAPAGGHLSVSSGFNSHGVPRTVSAGGSDKEPRVKFWWRFAEHAFAGGPAVEMKGSWSGPSPHVYGNPTFRLPVPGDLPIGPSQVRLTFEFKVDAAVDPREDPYGSPHTGGEREIRRWRRTFDLPFTVLPAGESGVEFVADPSLLAAMASGVSVGTWGFDAPTIPNAVRLIRGRDGQEYVRAMLAFAAPPTGVAADVVLRDKGGREVVIGSVTCRAGNSRQIGIAYTDWMPPDGFDPGPAGTVDLVLRPSVEQAAAMIDAPAVWGEPIVIGGVRLIDDRPD